MSAPAAGNPRATATFDLPTGSREVEMGRGILLLLLGVPLPIVLLLALFWH